jgi:hypothetical protein
MIALSLALRSWAAQAAVFAAVATLLSVAALVEGHAPSLRALASAGLVAAGLLGAAWVLGRWRAEGGDVALANVGVPPGRVLLLLFATSLPALALAPAPRRPAATGWTIGLSPDAVRVAHPAGALDVTWAGGVARRSDTGDVFAGLPPPASSDGPRPSAPWAAPAVRAALLAVLLSVLGRRRAPPGPALVLGASLAAIAAAHTAGALLSP